MATAIIALIAAIVGMIPWLLNRRKDSHANQQDMGKVDDRVLHDSMERIDILHPAKKDP